MVSCEPRTRFSVGPSTLNNSLPSNRTLPLTCALPSSSPMAAMKICVLPDPDSPTSPTHSEGAMLKDTPSTASMIPVRCEKLMRKRSTLNVGTMSAILDVEGVAQAIAEDVQAKQQNRQEAAGNQQDPGSGFHFAGTLGDQGAQACARFLNSQSKKAQEAFEQDDLRHGERGVHDHRSDDIGDDVPQDDAACAGSRCDRSLDEFPLTNAQGLAANDAGHGQPADGAYREKQEIFTAPKNDRQKYHEENQRQSAQDFDQSHHQMIGAAADVACDGPVAHADQQTDDARRQSDGNADPRAGECPHEQIASQAIGSEPMRTLHAGACRDVQPIECMRNVRADPRPEPCQHEDHAQRRHSYNGCGIRSRASRRRIGESAHSQCLTRGSSHAYKRSTSSPIPMSKVE